MTILYKKRKVNLAGLSSFFVSKMQQAVSGGTRGDKLLPPGSYEVVKSFVSLFQILVQRANPDPVGDDGVDDVVRGSQVHVSGIGKTGEYRWILMTNHAGVFRPLSPVPKNWRLYPEIQV